MSFGDFMKERNGVKSSPKEELDNSMKIEDAKALCRNPSFGLATKAKGVARVRAQGKPRSHIRDSRE
jgi:hypothetical protein